MLRPEVLGIIGLGVAAVVSLAIWFRMSPPGGASPSLCPHCGTMQHNLSRTAALAHEFMGSANCIACGKPLGRRR